MATYEQGVAIYIDPSGAQTGGRAVQRSLTDIGVAATETQKRIDGLTGVYRSVEGAARESAQSMMAQLDQLRAKYNPVFAVIQRYKTAQDEIRQAHRLGALSANELTQAISRERQAALLSISAIKARSAALEMTAKASRLAMFETRNLQFQLIDIAQSIPLAFQSPAFFLQNLGFQLAQIGQLFIGRGGLRAALSETVSMVGGIFARFARLAGILAGVGVAFEAIRNRASEAEGRTVGFGETAIAIFQTLRDTLSGTFIGQGFSAVAAGVGYAFDKIGSAAVDIAELVINSFRAAWHDITFTWNSLPDVFDAAFTGAVNKAIDSLNWLSGKATAIINNIIDGFNKIPGVAIGNVGNALQIAPRANPAADRLAQANQNAAAEVQAIMSSTPLRSFAGDVADRVHRNAALSDLSSLGNIGDIQFGNATQGVTSLGTALGSVVSNVNGVNVLGQSVGTLAKNAQMAQRGFENINQLVKDARFQQLQTVSAQEQQLEGLRAQYMAMSDKLNSMKSASVSSVFGDRFTGSGGAAAIENAATTIDKVFRALGEGRMTARQAYQAVEMVRTSLHQLGGDSASVDAFVNQIIYAELKTRALNSEVTTLSRNVASIPNRTFTITAVYKRVGDGTAASNLVPAASNGIGAGLTGTYSRYDAGGSEIGVHRYSSPTSGFVAPYVQQETYSSMAEAKARVEALQAHGYNATIAGSRATGGPVEAGKYYRVNENGTEIFQPSVNGVVLSAQASQASPFGDNEITKSLKATQENTASTVNVLQAINGKVASSGGFSSSFAGGSIGSSTGRTVEDSPDRRAAYARYVQDAVMRQNQFAYQITRNNMLPSNGGAIYGGPPNPLSYQEYLQSLSRSSSGSGSFFAGGFADGGIVMPGARRPGAGDTQHIGVVKRPDEAIAILKPDQLAALQKAGQGTTVQQTVSVTVKPTVVMQGDGRMTEQSRRRMTRDMVEQVTRAFDEIGRGQR